MTLEELTQRVWEFREARDWAQFHHPKELASALSIEVAEVMEHFRFRKEAEVDELLRDEEYRAKVGAELAEEYGITDVDGKQPPSHRPFLGDPPTFSDAVVQ